MPPARPATSADASHAITRIRTTLTPAIEAETASSRTACKRETKAPSSSEHHCAKRQRQHHQRGI